MLKYVVALAVVCLGCVGAPEENESGSSALEGEAALLNGTSRWGGEYVAIDAQQEIQKIEVLPCWLRVTYLGGTTISGNYEARAWPDGSGVIDAQLGDWTAGAGGWPVNGGESRPDGYFSVDASGPTLWYMADTGTDELVLSNVSAPGWTRGSSRLKHVRWTAGTTEQRWCLPTLETPPRVRRPDGDSTWIPRGLRMGAGAPEPGVYRAYWPADVLPPDPAEKPLAETEARRDVYDLFGASAGNSIATVTFGNCYMQICDIHQQCGGGNYTSAGEHEVTNGSLLDLRSGETSGVYPFGSGSHLLAHHPFELHDSSDRNLEWKGILLQVGGQRVVLEREGDLPFRDTWCWDRD